MEKMIPTKDDSTDDVNSVFMMADSEQGICCSTKTIVRNEGPNGKAFRGNY